MAKCEITKENIVKKIKNFSSIEDNIQILNLGNKKKIKLFFQGIDIDISDYENIEIVLEGNNNNLILGNNCYLKINGHNNSVFIGKNSSVLDRLGGNIIKNEDEERR